MVLVSLHGYHLATVLYLLSGAAVWKNISQNKLSQNLSYKMQDCGSCFGRIMYVFMWEFKTEWPVFTGEFEHCEASSHYYITLATLNCNSIWGGYVLCFKE